jgi:sec-independent protein translocase protein TatA
VYGWYQYLAVINCCRHCGSAFRDEKAELAGVRFGASIKGFKKAMSDDEKPEKSAPDADFTAKSIADKPDDAKKDETKRHDKEQV